MKGFMKLGYVGLGKMGKNMVLRLLEQGHQVVAWNRSPEPVAEVAAAGATGVTSLEALVQALPTPRSIWLMLPAGEPTQSLANRLAQLLAAGDTLIDGSNSFYKDSQQLAKQLAEKKIKYIDVGVSGGPAGAKNGACLMIGGDLASFEAHQELFTSVAVAGSFQFFEGAGAGHFVKMVHNGIEYGMMQALAEGLGVLAQAPYKLDLTKVAAIYNKNSVIESRLVDWLAKGLEQEGQNLENISGSVAHSGEGLWTVKTAKELGVSVPIIEGSLQFRLDSQTSPSFEGKILSLLRNQFGGHNVAKKSD